jgi:hypothetical protein
MKTMNKKLKLSKQTLRVLTHVELARAVGASDDDTSINSGLTICITRVATLCTVISKLCTVP